MNRVTKGLGELAISKKAIAAILGCVTMFLFDVLDYRNVESIEAIKQLLICYVLGQSVADFGKGAAQATRPKG